MIEGRDKIFSARFAIQRKDVLEAGGFERGWHRRALAHAPSRTCAEARHLGGGDEAIQDVKLQAAAV